MLKSTIFDKYIVSIILSYAGPRNNWITYWRNKTVSTIKYIPFWNGGDIDLFTSALSVRELHLNLLKDFDKYIGNYKPIDRNKDVSLKKKIYDIIIITIRNNVFLKKQHLNNFLKKQHLNNYLKNSNYLKIPRYLK